MGMGWGFFGGINCHVEYTAMHLEFAVTFTLEQLNVTDSAFLHFLSWRCDCPKEGEHVLTSLVCKQRYRC